MYGRHVHHLVCLQSQRNQYFGTFFLRNRAELSLMCRLLESKPRGAKLDIAVLACSKGAEVYSIVWAIRSARPDLSLNIRAVDISQEIVDFAKKGIYSRVGLDQWNALCNGASGDGKETIWNTCRDQNAPIFARMSEDELRAMCDVQGEEASIKPRLREGIGWLAGDANDPGLIRILGLQDIVVANRFLCHMDPAAAEKCLRNIAGLVKPGGYLFVSGVDLDVRTRVASSMGWKPVQEMMREIHEGDASLTQGWPLNYWGLEPFCAIRPDRNVRYASVFQIAEPVDPLSSSKREPNFQSLARLRAVQR
jgi:SAM-dependent methyltransferase